MISSGKLGSYLKRVGAVTPDEVLKLLNIATWFRCMSQEECQHLIPNIELRNDFSLDKEEDILVRLEIDDGADLIGLHDRYELKNRLKEYKRSATIKHLGAIGNLSKLSGFRS